MTAAVLNVAAVDENHPIGLAFHFINNAAQIARGLVDYPNDTGSMAEDGARMLELLIDAGRHVGEVYGVLQQHERTIEELRGDVALRDALLAALDDDKRELLEDGARQTQTIARLEATDTARAIRLCEVQKQKEDLVRDLSGALAEITELFNRAQGIVVYDRTPPRDLIIHEAPRMVAGRS